VSSPPATPRLGISPAAQSDANRLSLVIAVCNLAAGAFLTLALVQFAAHGGVNEETIAGLLGAVCALTLTAMARLGANINLVGNTLLTIGCAFMALSNFVSGDSEVFGAAFIWYLAVPVVATFLFGMRHGTVWSILVAIQIVAFLVLLEADLYRVAAAASIRVRFLAVIAALGFIHFILSFYERSRSTTHSLMQDRMQQLEEVNEQLRESRDQANLASEAKSQFLATVSHEIRTPLNGVIGMAGVLGTTQLNDEQDRFVSTIETSGNDLLRIIDDILDLARIEDDRVTLTERQFSLVDCVEDALEQHAVQASRKGLEFGYSIGHGVGDAFVGDRARLQQVLANLVSNAVKFTPTGSVVVSVDSQTKPDDGRALLSFRVSDTGIGIAGGSLQRLFKPFSQADSTTTRKYGGTGLGLVIAKELIVRMGGTIRVESVEGEGSTFVFSVVVGTAPSNASDEPPLDGWPVLVVYRTETSSELMCAHLDRLGADPVPVATERLSGGTITTDRYAVIVTDDPSTVVRLSRSGVPVVQVGEINKESRRESEQIVTRPIRTRRLRNVILEATAPEADAPGDAEVTAPAPIRAEPVTPAEPSTPAEPITPEPGAAGPTSASVEAAAIEAAEVEVGAVEPIVAPPQAPAPGPAPAHEVTRQPRILVAEDNAMNQTVVRRILSSIGLEATVVDNGADAVAAARAEQFDIVLMDLRMPVLDGVDATRQIREDCVGQPYIIAVTANAALRSPTD